MIGIVARTGMRVIGRPVPAPKIEVDAAVMLGALPVPIVLLDPENRFRFANHAAEQFLGLSMQQLSHMGLGDLLPADHPLFALILQVRQHGITIADHDLALESPRLHKQAIAVQATPLTEEPGSVLLSLQDASAARLLDRQTVFRSAARSVSGMAAVHASRCSPTRSAPSPAITRCTPGSRLTAPRSAGRSPCCGASAPSPAPRGPPPAPAASPARRPGQIGRKVRQQVDSLRRKALRHDPVHHALRVAGQVVAPGELTQIVVAAQPTQQHPRPARRETAQPRPIQATATRGANARTLRPARTRVSRSSRPPKPNCTGARPAASRRAAPRGVAADDRQNLVAGACQGSAQALVEQLGAAGFCAGHQVG